MLQIIRDSRGARICEFLNDPFERIIRTDFESFLDRLHGLIVHGILLQLLTEERNCPIAMRR